MASGGDSVQILHTILKKASPLSELKLRDAAMNLPGNLDDEPALMEEKDILKVKLTQSVEGRRH